MQQEIKCDGSQNNNFIFLFIIQISLACYLECPLVKGWLNRDGAFENIDVLEMGM